MFLCKVCRARFYCAEDVIDHQREVHDYCFKCDKVFVSERTWRSHMVQSLQHNFCEICEGDFQTPSALKNHQVVHEPKNISCPKCPAKFSTPSALLKHIEKSSCFGRFSHAEYVETIRRWEIKTGNKNLVTAPRLTWSGESSTIISTTYQATEAAWNGYRYECYFCDRQFDALYSLNQHLSSGFHQPKDFRCRKCFFTASWLSGLVEHFESGKCGLMNRDGVRELLRPFTHFRIGYRMPWVGSAVDSATAGTPTFISSYVHTGPGSFCYPTFILLSDYILR